MCTLLLECLGFYTELSTVEMKSTTWSENPQEFKELQPTIIIRLAEYQGVFQIFNSCMAS